MAYAQAQKFDNMITAEELGKIVLAALQEFKKIRFEKKAIGQQLRDDYQEDAQKALALLRDQKTPEIKSLLEQITQELLE
ncbi:MAG: hypothetical protein D3923_11655 [Candidatus Electrothrix sp. AR3]|nr:hypothetical protein [Candidatus Electrothrix sp. AR3]